MLSATNELDDMKRELRTGFEYYDYKTQGEMDDALIYAIEKTKRETMLDIIDSDTYDVIEAMDKIFLTDEQENIYYAEVNYSLAAFFGVKADQDWYRRRGQNEEESEGKMSWSSEGLTGLEYLVNKYNGIAVKYISKTDYVPVSSGAGQLKRRQSIHGN